MSSVVTATIVKPSPDAKVGIRLTQHVNGHLYVANINENSPFVDTGLRPGMMLLYVNDTPCAGMSVREVVTLLGSLQSTVSIVATMQPGPKKHIIFKKTWKIKPSGIQVANEKTFTFHGQAMNETIATAVQQHWSQLRLAGTAKPLKLVKDDSYGYRAEMNHDFQKYHEEDATAAVFDALSLLGWEFKFQYDSEMSSTKLGGSSYSQREMFIFYKNSPMTL